VDGTPFYQPGDVKLVAFGGQTFDNNLVKLYPFPGDATRLVVRYSGFGGTAPTASAILVSSGFTVLSAQRLRLYTSAQVASGCAYWDMIFYTGGSNLPEWWNSPVDGTARLAGTVVGTGTTDGQPYVDVDLLGLPTATDLTGVTGAVSTPSRNIYFYATGDVWSGNVAGTWARETRTLRFSGAHLTGVTSVSFKNVAALALRNWLNGDTLYADGYAWTVTAAASWATTGLATVTVSIPSGVTLPAGTRVWANWHGTSTFDSMMILAAAVTGPASTVSVRASDNYRANWDGTTAAAVALYRAGTDSYLEVLGNTFVVAATATANGSGQADVTLTADNVNAVGDNAVLRISRPAMLRATDPASGSVVRLLSPIGGGGATSAGVRSRATVYVPVGTTRTVTALVTFALSAGSHSDTPGVSIVNITGGVALIFAKVSDTAVTVLNTPTIARVVIQATIAATALLEVRIHGGASDPNVWQVALDAMFCISANDDIPWIGSSWANQLAQRGADALAAQRLPVANIVLDVALLRRWSDAPATAAPLVLGQTVAVPSVGVTRRILVYERSIVDPAVGRVEVGTVPTDLSRRVAAVAS
jgi:hypothetical protein